MLALPLVDDAPAARTRIFAAAAAVNAAAPCPTDAAPPSPPPPPFPRPSRPLDLAAAAAAGTGAGTTVGGGASVDGGRIRKPMPPRKKPMSPGLAVGGRRAVGALAAPPIFLAGVAKEVGLGFEATTTTRLSATFGLAAA